MLKCHTLRDFEDRSQLVQLRDTDTVQTAHCAMGKNSRYMLMMVGKTSWDNYNDDVNVERDVIGGGLRQR